MSGFPPLNLTISAVDSVDGEGAAAAAISFLAGSFALTLAEAPFMLLRAESERGREGGNDESGPPRTQNRSSHLLAPRGERDCSGARSGIHHQSTWKVLLLSTVHQQDSRQSP